MPKQITVQCSVEIAALLETALRWFVATRYPHGADECSIAAREALLDLARRFRDELAVDGRCVYSGRTRAFLSEAVSCYTRQCEQDSGQSWAFRRDELIAVCRGLSNGDGYAAALQRDQGADPG